MKPLGLGVLGLGEGRSIISAGVHSELWNVVCLCDTNTGLAQERCAEFGLTNYTTDYDTMLADPTIDAIYIPLPNHMHVEWTLKTLAAGKHVLTEKPIAMKAREIDQIIAARDRTKLLAAEAYMIVHHPQWQRAKEWLAAGEIGTLVHADVAFSFNLTEGGNIRNKPETGGGSLRDIGVYTFGSARFVTGAEAEAVDSRLIRENGIDTFALVFGTMAGNGRRFTYHSMTSMRLYNRQVVTFQGDKGMIRVEGGPFNANVNDLAKVELHVQGNRVITDRFPTANHYVLQVEAFGRSIREGAPYPCPLEFVQGTQRMMDMAYDRAVDIQP